jgi:hypothetical protein
MENASPETAVGNTSCLASLNIRKHYIKHYVSIKECINGKLAKAKQYYFLPFLSASLDLTQNEVQNKKLIGVRNSYNLHGTSYSWNLVVRDTTPFKDT